MDNELESTSTEENQEQSNDETNLDNSSESFDNNDLDGEGNGEQNTEEPNPNLLKLKVNGEELEYDVSNQEQLIKDLQLAKASQGKFEEAAQLARQVQEQEQQIGQLVQAIKSSPLDILNRLGIDVQKVAEDYLRPIYERMELPEAERQALEYQEQVQRQQAELEHYRQQEQQRQNEIQQARQVEHYKNEINRVIKESGLPETQDTVQYIAMAYKTALQNNPQTRLDDVIPQVKQAMQQNINQFAGNLEGEELIQAVGKDTAEKIRKFYLKQAGQTQEQEPQQNNKTPNTGEGQQTLSEQELRARLGI